MLVDAIRKITNLSEGSVTPSPSTCFFLRRHTSFMDDMSRCPEEFDTTFLIHKNESPMRLYFVTRVSNWSPFFIQRSSKTLKQFRPQTSASFPLRSIEHRFRWFVSKSFHGFIKARILPIQFPDSPTIAYCQSVFAKSQLHWHREIIRTF